MSEEEKKGWNKAGDEVTEAAKAVEQVAKKAGIIPWMVQEGFGKKLRRGVVKPGRALKI